VSELLAMARAQLEQDDANSSRRACWIARSAMEEQLDSLLAARGVDVGPRASTRSKLSCLEAAYDDHRGLPAKAQYVWSRLSEACHQHAYQLSPTHAEAAHLLALVESLDATDT
jgi:hypothetical protein